MEQIKIVKVVHLTIQMYPVKANDNIVEMTVKQFACCYTYGQYSHKKSKKCLPRTGVGWVVDLKWRILKQLLFGFHHLVHQSPGGCCKLHKSQERPRKKREPDVKVDHQSAAEVLSCTLQHNTVS